MSRPRTITDEQILEAARDLFLEQGFATSTAAIARAAGVSEGTVFKRFPTKDCLFMAALDLPSCDVESRLRDMAGSGDLRSNFREIALALTSFFRELIPRTMHLCTHPSFDPVTHLGDRPDSPPVRLLSAMTNLIEREIAMGRMRAGDPAVLARVLVGACHNFAFLDTVGVNKRLPMEAEDFVDGLLDLLWPGIACAKDGS